MDRVAGTRLEARARRDGDVDRARQDVADAVQLEGRVVAERRGRRLDRERVEAVELARRRAGQAVDAVGHPLDDSAPDPVDEGPPADAGSGCLRGAEVPMLGRGKVEEIGLNHDRRLRTT